MFRARLPVHQVNSFRTEDRTPVPYTIKIDKEQRLVTATVWDVLDKECVLSFRRDLKADPDFDPDFNQLVEYEAKTKLAMTSQEVKELMFSDPFSPVSRRAMVTNSELLFGYARMYATFLESTGQTKFRVFRNMGEAVLWIEGEQ